MELLRERMIGEARKRIDGKDPSHDIGHALRVLANAEFIASVEGGDLEIIVPAALLHDVVVYPKCSPQSKYSADHSAAEAGKIMNSVEGYPKCKIQYVMQAIREHSYKKGIKSTLLESQIIQDADRIECTGAVAIMRVFASTGQMQRPFYNADDPFCRKRKPSPGEHAMDLFYARYLQLHDKLNTETAKSMAIQRTQFLEKFIEQLGEEITYQRQ